MGIDSIKLLSAGILVAAVAGMAEGPSSGTITFTATADNVAAKNSVQIDLLRWSTDAELSQMMDAWNRTGAIAKKATAEAARAAAQAAAAARRVDKGLTGTARARQDDGGGAAAVAAAQKKAESDAAAGITSESLLMEAMKETPAVGYVWASGEVSGYMIRYAVRLPDPNGGERIVLVTNKRLGRWNNSWKPASGGISNYDFSVIELHVNAKGEGEGKASLTGKVHLDGAAKILMLDDYSDSPVIFRGVRKTS